MSLTSGVKQMYNNSITEVHDNQIICRGEENE